GVEAGAEAELWAGALFPLVGGRQVDANDDAGPFAHRNAAAKAIDAVGDEVVLADLAAVNAGDAGVERAKDERVLAAGEATGGRGDELDLVGLAALGAFVPPVVDARAHRTADLFVLLTRAFGHAVGEGPGGIFEVVASVVDARAGSGDEVAGGGA